MSSLPRSSDRNENEASRKQGRKHKDHSTTDPRTSEGSGEYQAISYANTSRQSASADPFQGQYEYTTEPYSTTGPSAVNFYDPNVTTPYTYSSSGPSQYAESSWQYDTTAPYYTYGSPAYDSGSTAYGDSLQPGVTYSKKGKNRELPKNYCGSSTTTAYQALDGYGHPAEPIPTGHEQPSNTGNRKGKGTGASSSGHPSSQDPAVRPADNSGIYDKVAEQTQLTAQFDTMGLSHAGSHGQGEYHSHQVQSTSSATPSSNLNKNPSTYYPGSQQIPKSSFNPDINIRLQYKSIDEWHDAKALWDTGSTFASLILRDLVINLGYRFEDIDFSKVAKLQGLGHKTVKTYGEVQIPCSLEEGHTSLECFQVLDKVVGDYQVLISPPGFRKDTPIVAASIQAKEPVTKNEVNEMKKSWEKAQKKRDEAKERIEKEHKRKKKSEEKKSSKR